MEADELTGELQELLTAGDQWREYEPIDLTPYIDGTYEQLRPSMLKRTDGKYLLYAGKRHWFQGEPESGKTWAALVACKEQLNVGNVVVYVDWESDPDELIG